MKLSITILFLFILLRSLSSISVKAQTVQSSYQTESFSLKDSLNKYSDADSVFFCEELSHVILFVGKANNINFGIWIPDSTLFFYQRLNKQWICTDSLAFDLYSFTKCIDLNGDGKKDIRISTVEGHSGNTFNKVFLYDDRLKRFRRNEGYDLSNVEFDQTNKCVRSSFFATMGSTKSKYRIEEDSLVLDSEINFKLKDNHKRAIVEIIDYSTGRKRIKKKYGRCDRMTIFFSNALWDSKGWYPN